ncbi:MAG TPA: carboxymuconolactone decarboxylase family protein [Dehalococcoidia bacterium]|nr:carboxymuconolactone decarboxylase family protein [Dehalococcoidia bacterium]
MSVVQKIEEPDNDDLRQMYQAFEAGGMGLGVLNIFKVAGHNPQLLRNWARMGNTMLFGGLLLSDRVRELVILRIGQLCGSEYEFGQHIRIAKAAGISYEEIAALQDYHESELFSEMEKAALAYTDASHRLDPDCADHARSLKRWLSDRELVELSFCIGHWGMVARVLVPLEVELDDSLAAQLPEGWREWM